MYSCVAKINMRNIPVATRIDGSCIEQGKLYSAHKS